MLINVSIKTAIGSVARLEGRFMPQEERGDCVFEGKLVACCQHKGEQKKVEEEVPDFAALFAEGRDRISIELPVKETAVMVVCDYYDPMNGSPEFSLNYQEESTFDVCLVTEQLRRDYSNAGGWGYKGVIQIFLGFKEGVEFSKGEPAYVDLKWDGDDFGVLVSEDEYRKFL